jgi:hypothetical protein
MPTSVKTRRIRVASHGGLVPSRYRDVFPFISLHEGFKSLPSVFPPKILILGSRLKGHERNEALELLLPPWALTKRVLESRQLGISKELKLTNLHQLTGRCYRRSSG